MVAQNVYFDGPENTVFQVSHITPGGGGGSHAKAYGDVPPKWVRLLFHQKSLDINMKYQHLDKTLDYHLFNQYGHHQKEK